MNNKLLYTENVYALKEETDYLACCFDERINATTDSFKHLGYRIEECEIQIKELFDLLAPVLDAMTEKLKQKWLWEIFEPNDIGIDFSYKI